MDRLSHPRRSHHRRAGNDLALWSDSPNYAFKPASLLLTKWQVHFSNATEKSNSRCAGESRRDVSQSPRTGEPLRFNAVFYPCFTPV